MSGLGWAAPLERCGGLKIKVRGGHKHPRSLLKMNSRALVLAVSCLLSTCGACCLLRVYPLFSLYRLTQPHTTMRFLQVLSVYGIVAAVAATAHRDEALPRHGSRTRINHHIQAEVAAHSRPAPASSSRTTTAVGRETPPSLSFFRGRRAAAKSAAAASVPAALAGTGSHEQSRALCVSGGNLEQLDEMREREEQKRVRSVLLYYPNLIGMVAPAYGTSYGTSNSHLSIFRAGVNHISFPASSNKASTQPQRHVGLHAPNLILWSLPQSIPEDILFHQPRYKRTSNPHRYLLRSDASPEALDEELAEQVAIFYFQFMSVAVSTAVYICTFLKPKKPTGPEQRNGRLIMFFHDVSIRSDSTPVPL